jgi:hypothetical protein
MDFISRKLVVLTVVVFLFTALAVAERSMQPGPDSGPPLVNWRAPATYASPVGIRLHPLNSQGEIGNGPSPFFPVDPCRQYDIRFDRELLRTTPI